MCFLKYFDNKNELAFGVIKRKEDFLIIPQYYFYFANLSLQINALTFRFITHTRIVYAYNAVQRFYIQRY